MDEKEKPDYYFSENFLSGLFYASFDSYIKSIKDFIDEHPKKLQLEATLKELQRGNIYFFFRIGSNLNDAVKLVQRKDVDSLFTDHAKFLAEFCREYPKMGPNNYVLFDPEDFNFMKEGSVQ